MELSRDKVKEIINDDWLLMDDCEGNKNCDVVKELARIALASLEAEPVCYLTWHQGFRAPDDCEEYVVEAKPGDKSCDGSPAFPVYTVQLAPVVPEEATPENIAILASTFAPRGVTYQWDRDECNAAADSWNACRAAMLQGAEPVMKANKSPERWVAVPVDMDSEMMRAVQVNSELGAYACANLAGAYSLFREFYDAAIAARPKNLDKK